MMHIEGVLNVMLNPRAGHTATADCWCEPNRIYMATVRGLPGITLVIEHNDDRTEHHLVTVNKRERDRALLATSNDPDASWITRVLSFEPPRALPPHDPNERNS